MRFFFSICPCSVKYHDITFSGPQYHQAKVNKRRHEELNILNSTFVYKKLVKWMSKCMWSPFRLLNLISEVYILGNRMNVSLTATVWPSPCLNGGNALPSSVDHESTLPSYFFICEQRIHVSSSVCFHSSTTRFFILDSSSS